VDFSPPTLPHTGIPCYSKTSSPSVRGWWSANWPWSPPMNYKEVVPFEDMARLV
jgi:hypothetical protein